MSHEQEPMKKNQLTQIELRAIWGLGTVFSLRMLGMFMVLPVITTYGMKLQDATAALIGLAVGIYGLTQAIFQIPLGLLSDRIGRKPLIIGGLLLFMLGSFIAAVSPTIWGIILGRALQGAGAISAAVMALLSDLTREQNRTKAMAFIGVSFGITFAVAMITGPIITNAFGLHSLFWIMAILAIVGIFIVKIIVPAALPQENHRESNPPTNGIGCILLNPELMKLNIGILCLHVLLMSTFIALPGALEKAGFAFDRHWKLYLITLLISFAGVIPPILYAEARQKMIPVFSCSIGLILISQISFSYTHVHLWILAFGLQIFFLAFNLLEALLPSLISKVAHPLYKGTAMGVYSTCQFIGVAVGGTLGGKILGSFGIQAVFLVGGVLTLFWLILSRTMREPLSKN